MPPTENAAPKLARPRFHVWMSTEDEPDAEPEYVGVVTITNQDQLTAEIQGKGYGVTDPRSMAFHLTNLWIWAAMVRTGQTKVRFPIFKTLLEYRPVDKESAEAADAAPDPTSGGQAPSIDSGLPLPSTTETSATG